MTATQSLSERLRQDAYDIEHWGEGGKRFINYATIGKNIADAADALDAKDAEIKKLRQTIDMTTPQSLSERLRDMHFSAAADSCDPEFNRALIEASDALDQQAAEIARLKQIIQDLHYEMRDEAARNE